MSPEPAPRPATPAARISLSGEERLMAFLLVLVALSIISARVGWPPLLQFFLSVGAVIPLAAFIGSATEALADKIGGRAGGLLNATFGNAPDLLVGVFGVQRGLIPMVKATLVGALISNSALIMGICYVVAGVLYRRPRFDAGEAGHHSVLMMLTAAAIIFPSVGALVLCGTGPCAGAAENHSIMEVSVGVSVVLLLAYASYVLFAIFGLESIAGRSEGADSELMHERALGHGPTSWPVWLSVAVLAGSTLLLIPVVDILTASVEPVTKVLGWTQVFVGMVIVANAGNVAEGYAAIRFAWARGGQDPSSADSGLDLALGIASASSIQIATFVAPLIVLYSLTMHNMSLVFSPVELAILAFLVIIFAYIGHDGESNWLEGVQLLALYAMAAIVFFVLPAHVFG